MLRQVFAWLHALDHRSVARNAVLGFLVFALLWKGGKTLETTWLLTALAWSVTFLYWYARPKTSVTLPVLWVLGLGFALWTGLAYWNSATQNYGLDEVLRTGSLMLIFFWTVREVSDRERGPVFIQKLTKTLVVATVLAGLIGYTIYLFQPVERFVGTFADSRFHTDYWPNAWAQYLLLAWPVVLYAVMQHRTALRLMGVGLVIGLLMLSYSRGAMIAFSGQLLLLTVIAYAKGGHHLEWKKAVAPVLTIGITALLTFTVVNAMRAQVHPVQSVTERVTFQSADGASSVTERRDFWKQALELGSERPLYGWGPYSFRFIQPRLQEGVFQTSDHPHNVFLKLAMERGRIAAFLFVLLVGFVVLAAARDHRPKMHFETAAFVAVAGLLAHNLIDYNMQFVSIGLLFWILLGILAAYSAAGSPIEISFTSKKIVRFFELTLGTILLLIVVVETPAMITSSLGRHSEDRGEMTEALEWYETSAHQWLSRDLHLSRTKILYEQGDYEGASQMIDTYFATNGEDARAWKRRGDIARATGDTEGALDLYEHAYRLARFNDIAVAAAVFDTLLALDRREEVDLRKEEFEQLVEQYVDAIEQNAHFIALSPNVEAVVIFANSLAELYPKEAPRYQVLAARADHHASLERARIEARPPGFLW